MTDNDDQGSIDIEKRLAAEADAELVEAGMTVGLGTGSTVAYLLVALAQRRLDVCYVATSRATFDAARRLGLDVRPFTGIDRLDVAIDGADQVDPVGWLVKGGGGAQTREKIVAAAAARYVVIVSSNKMVEFLAAPVPLELLTFGLDATLRALGDARLSDKPSSPDNGVLAEYFGPIGDPGELASRLSSIAGVVEHGLLATQLRVDSIRCSTEAGSGHPTSSLSACKRCLWVWFSLSSADLIPVKLTLSLMYDNDRGVEQSLMLGDGPATRKIGDCFETRSTSESGVRTKRKVATMPIRSARRCDAAVRA